MNDTTNRILWIDYAKVLGIFLVVLGHFQMVYEDVNGFIYMFHMPLFFFLSGVLCNKETFRRPIRELIKGRIFRLIIPYYFFQVVCGLIYFIRVKYSGNSVDIIPYCTDSLLGNPMHMFCVPGWFLWSLFWCNLLLFAYVHINKYCKTIFLATIIVLLFINKPHYFALFTVPGSFIYFYLGFYTKRHIPAIEKFSQTHTMSAYIIAALLLVITGVAYSRIGNLDIGKNYYTDYPIVALLTALAGVSAVLLVCTSMTRTNYIMGLISSGTITIMCLHIPIQQLLQLHIIKSDTDLFSSIACSIAIVILLSGIHKPLLKRVPILVGKRSEIKHCNQSQN